MRDTTGSVSGGIRSRLLWIVAIGGGVALVTGQALGVEQFGAVTSPVGLLGLCGFTSRTDLEESIDRLTAATDRLQTTAADAETDRAAEINRLADSVEALERTCRDGTDRDTNAGGGVAVARREVSRLVSDSSRSRSARIDRLLELGCEQFGVGHGVVIRRDDSTSGDAVDRIVESGVVDGLDSEVPKTMSQTIETDGMVAVADVDEQAETDRRAARELGVSCYLGSELRVDGERYGTLWFFDREPRADPFSAADLAFADLLVRWVSTLYERSERERVRRCKERAIEAAPIGLTITDATQPDNPIVYANAAFEDITGHSQAEIRGRNCRFLQGAGTEPEPVAQLRAAVDVEEPATVELRNYRKDGTPFWNHVRIAPVENDAGETTHFVGFQQDVTEGTETERQLSTLMSNIPGVVYRSRNDPSWPVEFVSDGCAELTGYDPESLIDGDIEWRTDVIHDADCELWETIEQALENRESYQMTYAIETADGERRWVTDRGRGIVDEDGDIEAIEGVVTDVTEQFESERELERTRQLLTQAQQLANVGAWELDVTCEPGELEWSEETCRIHGLPTDSDVDLDELIELYAPEARKQIEDALDRATEMGEGHELELQLHRADGERRWVRSIGEPVIEDGEVVAIRGSIQDITERKEREHELERYETVVQAIGAPVYTLDEDGYFEFLNDAIEPVTGYSPSDLIGKHVTTVMSDTDLETAQELIRELLRTDTPYRTFEMALQTSDGGAVDVENHTALLPMDDGSFAGTAGVVRDITSRKERERELELTSDLLQETQRIAAVGGWELDLRGEPPHSGMVTDELCRIHELPMGFELDHEEALAYYHPADRPRIQSAVQAAIENGESYELEARLITANNTERWVRTAGKPIEKDGEIVNLRGSLQDITERKEYELALESLHETARGLLQAESASAVANLVSETAADVLDVDGVGVYHLDAETNAFEPAAYTAGFADRCNGAPSIPVGDDDSVLWNTFVRDTRTSVDDASIIDRSPLFGSDVSGGLVVPIGDDVVIVFVGEPEAIDDEARRLIETLVATTEAAFDRLASEARLRERDAELEAQNRRLKRQIGINEIIRSIDQSLVRATSQDAVERTVCERLAATEDIAFAWIGTLDTNETGVDPSAWAGDGETYLDAVSLSTDEQVPEPAVATAATETSAVVSNVVAELQSEPWRKTALAHEFASCLCVPIELDEYSHGVLAVYATEPETFGDLERTVFEELGENIANSITAVQTRQALHADTLLELTLQFDDSESVLAHIARGAGATVEFEGVVTHTEDESRLFVTTDGATANAVEAIIDDLVTVTDWRLVAEQDTETDECLFEVTVTGTEFVSRLLRHSAHPRSIKATETGLEAVVDVSPTTNVREFVEMLAQTDPGVELVGRRDVERTMHTTGDLVASLFEPLTDRQLEVLRTAYFAGFFEWPRTSTGEEIAAMLGVSQPTINRHLRIGEQRLLAQLFGNEAHGILGGLGET